MDDIKSTITGFTKKISQTSSDLFKSTKLGMNLSNEETELRNLYIEIGKKVHEIYAYGGSLGSFFDEKYKEIVSIESRIEDIRNQIEISKGTKICSNCGKSVPKTSSFCPKCGTVINSNLDEMSSPSPQKNDINAFKNIKTEPTIKENNIPSQPSQINNSHIEKEISDIKQNQSEGKKCTVCNNLNAPNDKFCLYCGRML